MDEISPTQLTYVARIKWPENTTRWTVGPCGHWRRSDAIEDACALCARNELDAPYVDAAVYLE